MSDRCACAGSAGAPSSGLRAGGPPPRRRAATRPGGHGLAFDWRLLENLALSVPFMLSGGLHAANVAEALGITRAGGVDVSSGVERAPGDKDPAKIRAFIRAARAADAALAKPVRAAKVR